MLTIGWKLLKKAWNSVKIGRKRAILCSNCTFFFALFSVRKKFRYLPLCFYEQAITFCPILPIKPGIMPIIIPAQLVVLAWCVAPGVWASICDHIWLRKSLAFQQWFDIIKTDRSHKRSLTKILHLTDKNRYQNDRHPTTGRVTRMSEIERLEYWDRNVL